MSVLRYYDTNSNTWVPFASGAQGTTGTQGTIGNQGIQGITGSQGTTGIQGSVGLQGTQGLQGIQGVQGITGIQGLQGLQGIQGIQGPQGTQGLQGINGIQGTQGLQGLQGVQGTQGLSAPVVVSINPQTSTAYTLVLSDGNNMVELNSASAITLTIPTNATVAIPVGSMITIMQTGIGQVTVSPAVGVTFNYTPGNKLRTQWSSATLIKRATDTWVLIGDLVI